MRRWLLNVVVAVSLLLCVLTMALWFRSSGYVDLLQWSSGLRSNGHESFTYFFSREGAVAFGRYGMVWSSIPRGYQPRPRGFYSSFDPQHFGFPHDPFDPREIAALGGFE